MIKLCSVILLLVAAATAAMAQSIDYSQCGYKLSEVAIPDVPNKIYVSCKDGDQSERLQRAIDYVGSLKPDKQTGFRGAVLLGEGTFSISKPLRISRSGVVLRGADRQKTIIRKTGYDRGAAVYVEGAEGRSIDTLKLISNVPLSQQTVGLSGSLRAGDEVVVHRKSTKQWIERLGCSSFGGGSKLGYWAWHEGDEDVEWTRGIVKVAGNEATLDAPLTMAIDVDEGPCLVIRKDFSGNVADCGVENLTIESQYNHANQMDEDHCWDGISLSNAVDCYVRRVVFRHLAGSAVVVGRSGRQITVEDCASYEPVSEIGGWRRRTFLVNGERCLMQRLWSEHGIHDFAVGDCAAGPTAFVGCETFESLGYSGSVGPWATGILFDGVNIDGHDLKFTNLGLEKFGTGWNAANSMFYQCTAAGIYCSDPDTVNRNSAHGCWAQFNGNSTFTECNDHVKPWSKFASQLARRIGKEKAVEICHTLVRPTNVASNNPTPEQAAQLVSEAHKPRVTMEMWIDSVTYTADVSSANLRSVDKLPATSTPTHKSKTFILENGKLMVDGQLLMGGRHDTPWWNGRPRYNKIASATYALTRFVPGMETNGATTRVDSVVSLMKREGTVLFSQHYGLWYDRRRDDHERIRRRDGDVWPPFYEQPYARSGQGKAWDGLSLYDLTKPNNWYYQRLQDYSDAAATEGMALIEQHYFQHNILEAGAHWVDCPWRRANNVNGTPLPEPVPFTGDKRIYMADRFYDVADSVNARLHRTYIFTQLDKFKGRSNVIHSIGEEFTGPLSFVKFWLQTIKQWSKENNEKPLVMLAVNRDVQDSVLADPEISDVVSIIGIEQWYYTSKGLYAPEGGVNLAPRQYSRRLRPGGAGFDEVYRSVAEMRKLYPDKAVCYFGPAYPQTGWAVLMAGGSCPWLQIADDELRASISSLDKVSADGKSYILADGKGSSLVYAKEPISIDEAPGKYRIAKVDGSGKVAKAVLLDSKGAVRLDSRGIYLIQKASR